jgi:hypothetical protein
MDSYKKNVNLIPFECPKCVVRGFEGFDNQQFYFVAIFFPLAQKMFQNIKILLNFPF